MTHSFIIFDVLHKMKKMLTKYIVYIEYLMLLISFDIDFSFDKKQFVSYISYFDIKYLFDNKLKVS